MQPAGDAFTLSFNIVGAIDTLPTRRAVSRRAVPKRKTIVRVLPGDARAVQGVVLATSCAGTGKGARARPVRIGMRGAGANALTRWTERASTQNTRGTGEAEGAGNARPRRAVEPGARCIAYAAGNTRQ
jgi:hypothetical protein